MDNTEKQFKKKLIATFYEFDNFCKSHGIKYFAAYGTLIGAIRHKGLIPWDDDIDVWMLPEDYNKFCNLKGKVDGHYDIVDSRDEGYWLYDLAKFVDTNTTLWEFESLPCITGIYIDVFPLAACSMPFAIEIKKLYDKASYLVERSRMKHSNNELINIFRQHDWRELKFFIYDIICMPFMKNVWKRRHNEYQNEIKNGKGDMLISYEAMCREKNIFEKQWFENVEFADFENIKITIPSGYDKILTQLYGNYMELPPEEKRISHHSHYFLDLERRWTINEIKELKNARSYKQ